MREAFRAQLMIALYRCGRQADALAVFRDYREVLVEDLGLDPTPGLEDLERQILAHDPSLLLAQPAGLPLRGYRLGERLGTGHDGTVYAARLPGVDRDVVIRVIQESVADRPDVVRTFDEPRPSGWRPCATRPSSPCRTSGGSRVPPTSSCVGCTAAR